MAHASIGAGSRTIDEADAPDANEEYLLYQTLLGSWPLEPWRERATSRGEYIERIQAYMAKAMKEAKMNTSWIQPNEEWDSAMHDFVARILDPSPKNQVSPDVSPGGGRDRAARRDQFARRRRCLKLTSPGVPDIYQGNEIWDFSLVDPDNRRPVDYETAAAKCWTR